MIRASKNVLSPVLTLSLLIVFLAGISPALVVGHAFAQARSQRLARATTNYAALVDPLTGTSNGGDTFPGADVPFGMVQWSPDTVNDISGGYDYNDNRIKGFSLTHISGAGCDAFDDIPFMPYVGNVSASPASSPSTYISTFAHKNESAAAGYYKVALDNGVTTELTATQRSGAARFTYPSGQTATLLVNAAGSATGNSDAQVTVDGSTISGYATSGHFCGTGDTYTVYFWATFSQSFASYGTWQNGSVTPNSRQARGASTVAPAVKTANAARAQVVRGQKVTAQTKKAANVHPNSLSASGTGSGAYVTFDTSQNTAITARVGLSFVSVANAQANVNQEDANGDFDAVHAQATQTWNNLLGEVQVSGGSDAQTATLYTELYHSLLQPNVFSDDNGQYIGFDNKVYTTSSGHVQYANFSGWDIYRSEAQLLTLLQPNVGSDIAQSMVNDYTQSGELPKWSLANGETYVMVGDPADAIIADIYAFGGTNFDTGTALTAMVKQATQTSNIRPGLNYLLNQGYLPTDGSYGCCNFYAPASTTLEYNTADFSIAAFAQALGNTDTYNTFVNRAQDWKNLLNTGDKYLEPRAQNGSFPAGYNPNVNDGTFAEGDSAQYNWMVPFNLAGLFSAEGGNSAVVSRLDNFFTQLNAYDNSPYAWLGNEPSTEAPWEYDYAGAPSHTQSVVQRIVTSLYSTGPNGLPGNDDLGQMSSAGAFDLLGLFPETPGTATLVLGSPFFSSITISRPSGQTLQINAPGVSASNYYVQSLKVNGSDSNQPWVPASFITGNNTLDYTLGSSASSWGTDSANVPPSYGSVNGGSTGNFLTGFESGDPQPSYTNTVDTVSPGGNIKNVAGVLNTLSGPEAGVRNETSHTGNSALMYSGKATNAGDSDYAYMEIFDLSSQSIKVGASTALSYWIYPQSSSGNSNVSGNNSTCVAIDLVFSDGTSLRDSGALDQNGNRAHPAYQCNHLTPDSWNHVTVNLGQYVNGKTVVRIDEGYDQPNSTGGYRGYIDDISIG